MERFLTTDQLISFHRNQQNPKPHPVSTMTFAYDDVRYLKQANELQTEDDVLRKKVLEEINLDLHQSYEITKILKSDIPKALVALFEYKDDVIREYASRAFVQINKTHEGRIRENAYYALLYCADVREFNEKIVEEGVVEILVDKLLTEKNTDILKLTLQLLKLLLDVDIAPIKALKTQALSRLKLHLASDNWEIRQLAAINLGSLSFAYPGKLLTLRADTVIPLANLLKDEKPEVRAASSRALISLAQENQGKFELIENDFLDIVFNLLSDTDDQVRLNIVQLISNVGEHPVAKQFFKRNQRLDKLRDMEKKDLAIIRKFAGVAISVLTWLP